MKNYKYLLVAFIVIFSFASCSKESSVVDDNQAPRQDEPVTTPSVPVSIPETQPAIQTPVSVDVNGNCGGFYKALPARYDSTTIKYPLIVFLHGVGELGNGTTDLAKVINNGTPSRIKNKQFPPSFTVGGKAFSFIVITPQFKAWPSANDVDAVVKYASAHFRIDDARIYVVGLSMGGGVTWDYATDFGAKAAAVVPICGASWPSAARGKLMAAAGLPVWAFHNEGDPTVPVSYTNDFVRYINAENPAVPARKTVWPGGGHDAWTKATDPNYKENNLNIYEWMLQYSRENK